MSCDPSPGAGSDRLADGGEEEDPSSPENESYQRGSRLRPPPPPLPPRPRPPPNPPPPPAPEYSGFGRASLTVSFRPPMSYSLNSWIARCASSSVAISTNPNPRARGLASATLTMKLRTSGCPLLTLGRRSG